MKTKSFLSPVLFAALVLVAACAQLHAAAAKFTVTAIKIINSKGNVTNAVAGSPFFVQVDYNYANPVTTNYTARFVVNGWTNVTAPVNFGSGHTGTTSWELDDGSWLMYKAGKYSITVTVDPSNVITPASDTVKTMTTNFVVGGSIIPQWALVDVEYGRTNLSPGTDVIVGTMDDAFDYNDPLYTGNDSKGRPRLIAAWQNSLGVDGSPTNDVHSTACLGCVVARGLDNGDITGLAPDARYISAEFINRAGLSFLTEPDILDALNFDLTNHADVINMPWSESEGGSTLTSENGDEPITDLMADYIMYASNVFMVAYDNELANPHIPSAPGAARNVITVGGTTSDMLEVWSADDSGPTIDGRCKPDVLGGIATNCVTPSYQWREGFPAEYGYEGNSFAGPFVTGAAAQMIGYAKAHNLNRDHRLIKALIMNSGVPCLDDNGAVWSATPTSPMDFQQGTGIMKLQRVYQMYSVGQQTTGPVHVPGYDATTIVGNIAANQTIGSSNGVVTYLLGGPTIANADLDVTLAWDRHTYWQDVNGNGIIDAGDSFYVDTNSDAQSILHLTLYQNGSVVAQSISDIDTIQHLHLTNLTAGAYQLNVEREYVAAAGNGEPYGLAWYSTVPWTNIPPTLSIASATLASGNNINLQFRIASGQASNIQIQSASTLTSPLWTTQPATLTQTGPSTFQAQIPIRPGSAFFRIVSRQ